MGILSSLFGIIPPEQPPVLNTIFPTAAAQKIRNGVLPTIQADKIILSAGEVCHFVDVGAALTGKKKYRRVHSGGSYHMWKGYTAHLGHSESVPISEPEYTKGIFYITNERVIFVAKNHGFDKKIKNLTAITPYTDAIGLQFGSKTYNLLLPDGETPKLVLDMLI